MLKSIRGMTSFKACGTGIYKFINAVRDNGITCTSQHCHDQCFYGQVYNHDYKKLVGLAEKMGVEIETIERKGVILKAKKYKARLGIIIGLIAVACFVFYISNIVVTIEVHGNTDVAEEQVISALSDMGIYKGRFIADINFWECEKKLRLSIPEIAWTGIRHTGSRIVVDITEIDEPPEMVLNDIPCNIVALHDAQITDVTVYYGRLVKPKGDAVKKGDIIISGIIEDEKGKIIKRHAMGEIKGIYTEEIIFTQALEETDIVYSGNDETKKYFDFFGMRAPLFFKDVKYDTYEYHENTNHFMMFGKKLPIGIVHSSYTPFSYQDVSYTAEEAEKKLEQKISLHEKNFYDNKNIEIIERVINKNMLKDKEEFTVKYTLKGNIGIDKEIYVKK